MDPRALRRFRSHRGALIGSAMVLFVVLVAAFGPMVFGLDPLTSDFESGRGAAGEPAGPSAAHWLGTDSVYRDELARLVYGARLSLVIGVAASALSLLIGTTFGLLAGYSQGRTIGPGVLGVSLDGIIMRIVDIGLCFPFLILVMAIGAALDETTVGTVLVVLGSTSWLGTARIVRSQTMRVRDLDFVTASRALGQRTPMVLVRHVLPNVAGTLIVLGTISVAQMILAESALSYLNLGLPPPTPSWGTMLLEGQRYFAGAPWLLAAPGVAILVAVMGFNLLGEGLREALDARESPP
ncbi:MAG TPA: ABC transporter permease [Polyangiaceae bacterium]|nr:ABC transporter permease [Polyangiaceae bacterium]